MQAKNAIVLYFFTMFTILDPSCDPSCYHVDFGEQLRRQAVQTTVRLYETCSGTYKVYIGSDEIKEDVSNLMIVGKNISIFANIYSDGKFKASYSHTISIRYGMTVFADIKPRQPSVWLKKNSSAFATSLTTPQTSDSKSSSNIPSLPAISQYKKPKPTYKEVILVTGKKGFQCNRCGYTTNAKSSIVRHVNRKTPCEEPR